MEKNMKSLTSELARVDRVKLRGYGPRDTPVLVVDKE